MKNMILDRISWHGEGLLWSSSSEYYGAVEIFAAFVIYVNQVEVLWRKVVT